MPRRKKSNIGQWTRNATRKRIKKRGQPATRDTTSLQIEITPTQSTSEDGQVPSGPSNRPKFAVERPRKQVDKVLDKIGKRTEEPVQAYPQKNEQDYDVYGEHIAEKLRKLPLSMAPLCMKLVNEAIFMAQYGHLDLTSKIVTERPTTPLPPSPSTSHLD